MCTNTQVVAICIQVRLDVPRQEGAELTEERADQRDTEVERQRRLYKQWREAEEVPQPYVRFCNHMPERHQPCVAGAA